MGPLQLTFTFWQNEAPAPTPPVGDSYVTETGDPYVTETGDPYVTES